MVFFCDEINSNDDLRIVSRGCFYFPITPLDIIKIDNIEINEHNKKTFTLWPVILETFLHKNTAAFYFNNYEDGSISLWRFE